MAIKSLTYTSFASLDLDAADLEAIHRSALRSNALDGVTGILIFNGTHFLQIMEGSSQAIDELVERLRRDPRHSGFEIRDEQMIEARNFPDWTMELVRASASYFEARDTVAERLPQALDPAVREHVIKMTDTISGTVRI